MTVLTRRDLMALLLAAPAAAYAFNDDSAEWISLFDGKSLDGWKANEHADAFKVVDGQIAAQGGRSHLFYVGSVKNADFKNFELSAEVMTRPNANSGIYFHTAYQPSGWPAAGFEVQVSNTDERKIGYSERKKTGSLYAVRNVYKQLVNDNEWFQMNILVRGKQVQIRVNNMLVVDYVERFSDCVGSTWTLRRVPLLSRNAPMKVTQLLRKHELRAARHLWIRLQ